MIISIISLLGVITLSALFFQQQQFLKHFTKGISKQDLKTALKHLSKQIEQLDAGQEQQRQQINAIEKAMQLHFQKMGFMRFNPYSDTGGDQSFCFCLLDDHNNGIVITSLHSREQTRIYAKKVMQGKVEGNVLSKEEEQALKQALRKSTKK